MRKRKIFFIIISVIIQISFSANVSSTLSFEQKYSLAEYIEIFKPYAIKEMNRTGVPASITMAQAVIESSFGNSELALNANNHFGIKNKPDWTGQIYYYSKDKCYYKKYNSIVESYEDHSNHLKSRKWYDDLFKLKITDYKSWAHGLKKAGYAVDPIYAEKLIKIIEKYNFSSFDYYYISADSTFADQQKQQKQAPSL